MLRPAFSVLALALCATAATTSSKTSTSTSTAHVVQATSKPGIPLATVHRSCVEQGVVALTFDDGPYIFQNTLVDTLDKAGIKATFFINGDNWRCIYDPAMVSAVQRTFSMGHEFQSHTWHHHNLSAMSWDTIHNEMYLTELAMNRILGVQPAIMRPPYGAYNTLVQQASHVRNQTMVTWDFDSRDSDGATVAQSNALYDALPKSGGKKSVLALNHETYNTTVNSVVPHAISALKSKGYRFVTVSQCLGIKPYQWTAKAQKPTSSWKC